MRLYFIRHGESTSNYGEFITGQHDVMLTELGQQQAKDAGKYITAQGIKFDTIISSPLIRARTTALLVAHEIDYPVEDIIFNDLVMERFFGSLEGKIRSDYEDFSEDFIKANGGERETELGDRAQIFLDSLKGQQGNVLVVSHTGFGRWLTSLVTHTEINKVNDYKNAELTDLGEL